MKNCVLTPVTAQVVEFLIKLSFLKNLFNYEREILPRINYIKIINTIWNHFYFIIT